MGCMEQTRPRFPGLDGALAVAVALGVTSLAAGITSSVPSAVSAVGGYVVDAAPPFLRDVAIAVFGTSDKGALAVGTVVIALLFGVFVGRLAVARFWVAWAAFAAFALLGTVAQLPEPNAEPLLVLFTTGLAALAGVFVLRFLYRADAAAFRPEDPTDGRATDAARRRFVFAAAGAGVGGAAALAAGRWATIRRSETLRVAIGLPAPDVPLAAPGPENGFAIDGLTELVQHEPRFYRIDTALIVPVVDVESWSVRIHGMVENEVVLTMDDLRAMEQHERYITLSCVSNPVGDDLVGNAKWQGVRLTEVLDMARPTAGAGQLVGRSVDGFTVGFPLEAAYDGRDPLIAIGMNGVPLPRKHGYPARIVVPGLYGYVSATKWLSEIELTTWDGFDAYWVPRGWAKEAPIKTQSRIDVPRPFEPIAAGPATAAGIAWAPTRGISRVEVQLDDGMWTEAEVSVPLSADAWVQWRVDLDIPEGRHRLRVRATDGTGETQTEVVSSPRPDGATGWHTIALTAG
jgi:DMSO/TMAO reductase YedYZ molybdopterin-dependent catalytic subunit